MKLMDRIQGNYRFVVWVNSLLLGLGLTGVIMPALSAILHNASTVGASMKSLSHLLDEEE